MTDNERMSILEGIAAKVIVDSDGGKDKKGKDLARDYACALLTLDLMISNKTTAKDAIFNAALGRGYLAIHPELRVFKKLMQIVIEDAEAEEEENNED